MVADILDAGVDLGERNAAVVLPRKAAARAMPTVHGAHVGDQKQHAVGIAVREPGCRGIGVLVQRVRILIVGIVQLLGARDRHLADRIVGIVEVDQREIVGRDRHAQLSQRLFDPVLLIGRQGHDLLEIVDRFGAVFHLPMPVVPKRLGNVGKQTVAGFHNGSPFSESSFVPRAGYVRCRRTIESGGGKPVC